VQSALQEIEQSESWQSGLQKVVIPPSVEVIGEGPFSFARAVVAMAFEAGAALPEIGKGAFGSGKAFDFATF
jgi:hypothetical protein